MFSFRRFKTSGVNRSKRYKQIVIPIYLSQTKELAIRQIRDKAPKKHLLPDIRWQEMRRPVASAMMLAGLVGTVVFTSQLIFSQRLQAVSAFSGSPVASSVAKSEKPKGLTRSVPTRLVIGSIGVDTRIMEVGLLPDGSLETPPLFESITGWYKGGPSPGQIGPAIIAGHIDTYKGPAVFWNLRKVQLNDQIQITRSDGVIVTYLVTALKQFEQDNFPTQEVYGNTDDAQLRLITCGGSFNHKTLHYSQNTVVFASILPSETETTVKPVINNLVNILDKQKFKVL